MAGGTAIPQDPPIPDGLLWHYTDFRAFEGILGGKFWATDIRYLNDTTEYEYLIEFAFDAAIAIGSPDPSMPIVSTESIVMTMRRYVKTLSKPAIYVSCFSRKEDDLSQWRGYSPTPFGLAMGFDEIVLRKCVESQEFEMRDCQYGVDPKAMQDKLKEFYDRPRSHPAYTDDFNKGLRERPEIFYGMSVQAFCEDLPKNAAYTKHPAFKAEEEVRVAGEGKAAAKFRTSRSMIVPYIEWEAPLEALRFIVIGPGPHRNENVASVRKLWTGGQVAGSLIPFRNW